MESGGDLLSRTVTSQVPSALKGLTSVFGMGTGGSPSSLPPERVNFPNINLNRSAPTGACSLVVPVDSVVSNGDLLSPFETIGPFSLPYLPPPGPSG